MASIYYHALTIFHQNLIANSDEGSPSRKGVGSGTANIYVGMIEEVGKEQRPCLHLGSIYYVLFSEGEKVYVYISWRK